MPISKIEFNPSRIPAYTSGDQSVADILDDKLYGQYTFEKKNDRKYINPMDSNPLHTPSITLVTQTEKKSNYSFQLSKIYNFFTFQKLSQICGLILLVINIYNIYFGYTVFIQIKFFYKYNLLENLLVFLDKSHIVWRIVVPYILFVLNCIINLKFK